MGLKIIKMFISKAKKLGIETQEEEESENKVLSRRRVSFSRGGRTRARNVRSLEKQQQQGERKERILCSALLNERPNADRLIYSNVFNNI